MTVISRCWTIAVLNGNRIANIDNHLAVLDSSGTVVGNTLANHNNHFDVLDDSGTYFGNKSQNHDDHFSNVDDSMTVVNNRIENFDNQFTVVYTSMDYTNETVSSLINSATNWIDRPGVQPMTGDLETVGINNVGLLRSTGTTEMAGNVYIYRSSMSFTNTGVAIGTGTHTAQLSIRAPSNTSTNIFQVQNWKGTTVSSFNMYNDFFYWRGYDDTGALGYQINSKGDSYFLGGNLGMAIDAPLYKLHVNGTSGFVGNMTSTGTYINTGNIWVLGSGKSVVMYDTVVTTQAYKLQITNGELAISKW